MKKTQPRDWFALRGQLPKTQQTAFGLVGIAAVLFLWWGIVESGLVARQILPSPYQVFASLPELHFKEALVRNMGYSIKLNVLGYMFAVATAIPLGFVLGLQPLLRSMAMPFINGFRYIPLSATTSLFILWLGIEAEMKVSFLAFAIFVYLVPAVIQRVDEVNQVYINTIRTLGASRWQTIRHVYLPDVLSRVWEDVVLLVAISWTYIIIAELINKSSGGVGALIYMAQRQSRPDKMFALLLAIMAVGFLQDRLFRLIGRLAFPFKNKAR